MPTSAHIYLLSYVRHKNPEAGGGQEEVTAWAPSMAQSSRLKMAKGVCLPQPHHLHRHCLPEVKSRLTKEALSRHPRAHMTLRATRSQVRTHTRSSNAQDLLNLYLGNLLTGIFEENGHITRDCGSNTPCTQILQSIVNTFYLKKSVLDNITSA